MRILTALTYYRPHTSGLTIYAERVARALVESGHEVTVLTSRFSPNLPSERMEDGVRVVRVPVTARLGKGVLMPTLGWVATRETLAHDVVHLHLPQFDAAGLALRSRLMGKPTVITYHCDLELPPGVLNRVTDGVVATMNHIAARCADKVVVYTDDFADSSPYLRRYRSKRVVILPPVELPRAAAQSSLPPFDGSPVIGMATRFASEKGIEVLLRALPAVLERYPDLRVLFAGQHEGVWGEERYKARLEGEIKRLQNLGVWHYLGVLPPDQMRHFYQAIDVLAVPSLNSTESFGLVQIEAMLQGKPSVASDLPGVRQPVRMTGMGSVVPVGDSIALAEALLANLSAREDEGDAVTLTDRQIEILSGFAPARCAQSYESLFETLRSQKNST